MARYRDNDDYGERRPRQRPPSRRARDDDRGFDRDDDYDRPRRSQRGASQRGSSRRARAPERRPAASRRAPASYRAQRTRKRRQGLSPTVAAGMVINVVLISVLGVIYLFFPGAWQRLIHFRDSGPPPLAAGADLVVLAHTVPWGVASLADGSAPIATPSGTAPPTASPQASPQATSTPQPATTPRASPTAALSSALQPAGTASGYSYFRLARGMHTLTYTAAPFATLRCQISVPAASGDTCPVAHIPPSDAIRALGAARVVDTQDSADHLSADQQKTLVDAIGAALGPPPTTVAPFERYLNASGQVVYTYSSLQATLQYAVNSDPAHAIALPAPPPSATPTAGTTPAAAATASPTAAATAAPTATPAPPATCISLCDALIATTDAPTDAWNQFANLAPSWRYQPSRGAAIAAPVASQGSAATSVTVNIRWNGQWQVGAKDADKAALLSSAVSAAAGALRMPSGWSVKTYPATNPADGYLVLAGPSAGGASAQVLYRFGVLLAVNSIAYATFPSLPHGNFAERALAAGIKTQ